MSKPPVKSEKPSQPNEATSLEAELERQLAPILPSAQRSQVLTRIVRIVQSESFSGPIAHPKHLREYEEILPGSAERIVAMAESSLAHAQSLQDRAMRADIEDMRTGRWLGAGMLTVLIAAASVAAVYENTTLALAFLGTGVLGAVGHIINGRIGK